MEYTQWDKPLFPEYEKDPVLILVVMEYTQWDGKFNECKRLCVLILVVMEYTQWDLSMTQSLTTLSS